MTSHIHGLRYIRLNTKLYISSDNIECLERIHIFAHVTNEQGFLHLGGLAFFLDPQPTVFVSAPHLQVNWAVTRHGKHDPWWQMAVQRWLRQASDLPQTISHGGQAPSQHYEKVYRRRGGGLESWRSIFRRSRKAWLKFRS